MINIEPVEGFEPTTPRLQITCSGQLSYTGKLNIFPYKKQVFFTSPLRGANIQQFFIPPTKIFVFFKISY